MYLIIFDNKAITKNRTYYYCANSEYIKVKKCFPQIVELGKNEIDKVIIYSGSKENYETLALEADVVSVERTENNIKINYNNIKDSETNCISIKNQIRYYCLTKGLITKNEFPPFICVFDINDYVNIMNNYNKILSFRKEIDKFKARGQWIDIINLFGNLTDIESSLFWNQIDTLGELAFALGRVVNNDYKNISVEKKQILFPIFLKCINHCIEKEPDHYKYKSTLAFYYYNKIMGSKRLDNHLYDKTIGLYEELRRYSQHKYKEQYRYIKLKEIKFNFTKMNLNDNYYIKLDEIINDYKKLIEEYKNLNPLDKEMEKNNYIKALFSCASLILKNINYWKIFIDIKIYKKEIDKFTFSTKKLDSILLVERYLQEILSFKLEEENKIKEPNYLFVLYRYAELEQYKGLIYILKNKEDSNKYFIKSNNLIKEAFTFYNRNKSRNTNLKFPYYMNPIKAINHYFLKEFNQIDKCFISPKSYMYYTQAILYILMGKKDEALNIMSNISIKDKTNYKNVEKIKELLKNEN